jgi:hypothetical protein
VLPENKWLGGLDRAIGKQHEMHACVIGSQIIGIRFPSSDDIAMGILSSALKVAEKPDAGRNIHVKTRLGTLVHTWLGHAVEIEFRCARKNANE